MKVLKVTNSPKDPMDNVPSNKDANDAILEKPIRRLRYCIQTKAEQQTIKQNIPMSEGLPVVTTNL